MTLARWDTDVLGGLRHSLYDHPECVPQIVLWPAEEGVIGDLETKTQGHGCGTWAEAWKTGASRGGDPVATREGCMPVSSRQLRARPRGDLSEGATSLTENPGGRHLLKLRFQLERFADGEISCWRRKLP